MLERGEVANSWRRERWDSLRLLTPNWQSRLPGYPYDGIKIKFRIDADAPRKDIEALVAQSQKRSAVYDAITNPTNVSVSVAKKSVN